MSQQLKPIVFKNIELISVEKDDYDTDVAYVELIFDDEEKCVAHKHYPVDIDTSMKFTDEKTLDTNGYYACGVLTEGGKYIGAFYNDNLIDVFNKF